MEIPPSPRLPTGSLRNISLQAARGHYVATWDDDDWHAPTRLAEQVDAIQQERAVACVLWRLILFDTVTRSAFRSAARGWEGTLVAERSVMPAYPELQRGSDTPVVARLRAGGKLVALDKPELYIYVYHGGNTWNRAHWEENLLPHAEVLPAGEAGRVRSLLMTE